MNAIKMNTTTAPSKTEEQQKQRKKRGFPNDDPNPQVKPKIKA